MAPVHFKIFLNMAVSYGVAKLKAVMGVNNMVLYELQKGTHETNV
jgi:hypothetical protein